MCNCNKLFEIIQYIINFTTTYKLENQNSLFLERLFGERAKTYFRKLGKTLATEELFFKASAVAFNLFLCAIPFTLLLVSILGYVLSFEDAFTEIINLGRDFFPSFRYETGEGDVITGAITIRDMLLPLVQNRRIFGLIGFGILIFFTQGLFNTVKHVIFDIFQIKDHKHPFLELLYNFLSIGIVGSVFVFFSMSIFLLSLLTFNEVQLPFTELVIKLGGLLNVVNILLPFIFTLFLFYVIYRFISERRMSKSVAFVGAISYTILFETARAGVGIYLNYAIQAYAYFYQGYTLLVVIFFWTFYASIIFVVSTIAARVYQDIYTTDKAGTDENPYTIIS